MISMHRNIFILLSQDLILLPYLPIKLCGGNSSLTQYICITAIHFGWSKSSSWYAVAWRSFQGVAGLRWVVMSGETLFLLLPCSWLNLQACIIWCLRASGVNCRGFHWHEIGAMESENTLPKSSGETTAPFYNFREVFFFFFIITFLQKVETSG